MSSRALRKVVAKNMEPNIASAGMAAASEPSALTSAAAASPIAVAPLVASASSTATFSANGKRPRDWFGAAGDGGAQVRSKAKVEQALHSQEVASKVSSIKSKLSKPKDVKLSTGETLRRTGLTRDELLSNQARHEEKLKANGKAVPHYRKQ